VAMLANCEVKHVDSGPGSLRSMDTDRHPTPYKISIPEPVGTAVGTEGHPPVVPPSAPQPHHHGGTQLEVPRDDMDPVSPDTRLRGWLMTIPASHSARKCRWLRGLTPR